MVITRVWIGAAVAYLLPIAHDIPVVIDAFSAGSTECAFRLVAGKFFCAKRYLHPLLAKQDIFRKFAIGEHLLLILVLDFRMKSARRFPGRLASADAHRPATFDIDKCCGHLAPVAKLQRALAQAAAGDDGDSIGGTAVNLHKCDKPLTIFSAGIVETEAVASQHRHAHTQHLAGAKMAVGNFGFLQQFVHILHVCRVRTDGQKIDKHIFLVWHIMCVT